MNRKATQLGVVWRPKLSLLGLLLGVSVIAIIFGYLRWSGVFRIGRQDRPYLEMTRGSDPGCPPGKAEDVIMSGCALETGEIISFFDRPPFGTVDEFAITHADSLFVVRRSEKVGGCGPRRAIDEISDIPWIDEGYRLAFEYISGSSGVSTADGVGVEGGQRISLPTSLRTWASKTSIDNFIRLRATKSRGEEKLSSRTEG